MAFIDFLFYVADSGEQQESEEESEEDDMQERCEASNTQSHGLVFKLLV